MTASTLPRRAAAFLLRSAISIVPRDAIDWGHAMLSELCYVEGDWSALLWSLGSIGVLAKCALVTALFGNANYSIVPSGGHSFSKEAPVRKVTLYTTTACIIASLLFFVAPVFRQAFRVSLAQWHHVFHVQEPFTEQHDEAVLKNLGRRAEQNHDAEALAFVALRTWDHSESARLADEAVNLDPNLIWVYAAAGTYYLPSFDPRRLSALEQWDPQNALPHLITAERIDLDHVDRANIPHSVNEEPAAWRDAMAAAFQSPKLDTYVEQQKQMDRRVLARYHIDDPFQAVSYQNWYGLPSYAFSDSSRYAELLLDAGKSLEAHGDRKAAAAKYLTVARFAQMLDVPFQFRPRPKELKEALIRLGSLSQADGNKDQAAFYRALADQLDKAWEKHVASWQSTYRGSDLSHWNALLVRLSGSLILLFGALLTLCLIGVMIRSRSLRPTSLRPGGLTLALAFTSAVGAALASAVLFVSYWPYSHVLQRFVSTADESGLSELSNFLGDSQLPLGSRYLDSWYVGVSSHVYYFWLGVTVLCALVLLAAVLRHLQTRPRDASL